MRYLLADRLFLSFLPTGCSLQECPVKKRVALIPRNNPRPAAQLFGPWFGRVGGRVVGPQLTVQGKASRSDGDEAELLARGEAQRTLSARRSAVGAAAISYACITQSTARSRASSSGRDGISSYEMLNLFMDLFT